MGDLVHWQQNHHEPSPRFAKYDYGSKCEGPLGQPRPCNQQAYGMLETPVYDLAAIHTPLAFFTGEHA